MTIIGKVEPGKQLGRLLGYPTANVRPEGAPVLPENGVYAASILLEGEVIPRPCMLNKGIHPTVPDGKATIEAHLLDFDGDLYGWRVQLEYLQFLRPERRFEDLDALKAQLRRDLAATREWFEAHPL